MAAISIPGAKRAPVRGIVTGLAVAATVAVGAITITNVVNDDGNTNTAAVSSGVVESVDPGQSAVFDAISRSQLVQHRTGHLAAMASALAVPQAQATTGVQDFGDVTNAIASALAVPQAQATTGVQDFSDTLTSVANSLEAPATATSDIGELNARLDPMLGSFPVATNDTPLSVYTGLIPQVETNDVALPVYTGLI